MAPTQYVRRLVLSLLVICLLLSPAIATLPSATQAQTQEAVLVVDNDTDSEANYSTIQAAVNNSSDGDRIEVRPGTYREQVVVDKNVTLVAPDGATLNGSTLPDRSTVNAIRIPEGSPAEPVIAGFSITGYVIHIQAVRTTGAWTIRKVSTSGGNLPISARGSTGAWQIQRVTLKNTRSKGVIAAGTTGDWTISKSTIRDTRGGAVQATGSSGNWTIRDTSLLNSTKFGVDAGFTDGNWTVVDTLVDSTSFGIRARASTGAWRIVNSRIVNTTLGPRLGTPVEGTGVDAINTTGRWRIEKSVITGSTDSDVNATGAEIRGNATRNWWGQRSGAEEGQCVGNVTCANPLPDHPGPLALNPRLRTPGDIDADGLYEDVNGDGTVNIIDVATLLAEFDDLTDTNRRFFDFTGDRKINIIDVATLLDEI